VKTIALLACLLFGLGVARQQAPRDAPPNATAGSVVVHGRVQGVHGEPLADAVVVALSPSPVHAATLRVSRSARTDSNGRYSIDKLPPGMYVVVGWAPGYMATAFGGGALFGLAPFDGRTVNVVLNDGERFDATIALPRVSVLSGTIVDEYGLPAVANVSIIVRRPTGARSSPIAIVARVQSDREGRYRIEGLPPNAYLVRAERPNAVSDVRRVEAGMIAAARLALDRSTAPAPVRNPAGEPAYAYRPVYYFGVTSSRAARPVRVEPGSEHTGIDLQLQVTRTVAFVATVLDAAGNPPDSATVKLIGEDEAVEYLGAMIAPGRFQFSAVPPGPYVLASRAAVARLPEASRAVLWAAQDVFVDAETKTSPALTLRPGASMSGRVVFDGNRPIPELMRAALPVVELIPLSGEFIRFALPNAALRTGDSAGTPRAGGTTFSFEGVAPGRYLIGSRASGGWTLRSATFDGADISAVPFDVRAGDDLKDLVLTFTDQPASLTGTIRNESGAPVYEHTLVVFPVDRRARVAVPGGRVTAVRPDSRGRYEVRALAPGDYLVALARGVSVDALSEEMLSAFEAAAVRVTLIEGKETIQDLLAQTGR